MKHSFIIFVLLSIVLVGCATQNPYSKLYDYNNKLLQSGKITPEKYDRNMQMLSQSEANWRRQQERDNRATLAAITGAMAQTPYNASQPQYQNPQIIQPSGGSYRVQHVGGSTYRVDDMSPTVIPAPRNE